MHNHKVDVCVATYKRPNLLIQLLQSLVSQLGNGLTLRIIVIDNDSDESARYAVSDFAATHACDILYDIEPIQGISQARNRALRHVTADYVAFLDDDETASPNWLGTMYDTLQYFNADVVFGPVIKHLPDSAPIWARAHPSFSRPRKVTGAYVIHGASGNVLIRRAALGQPLQAFDPAFALTGGEDADFFFRLYLTGKRLVWCNEAEVYERVAVERTTVGWVCRRAFSGGQSFARIFVRRYSFLRKCFWFLQKLYQLCVVLLALPVVLFFSYSLFVRLLCRLCAVLGQLSICLGNSFLHKEYDKAVSQMTSNHTIPRL